VRRFMVDEAVGATDGVAEVPADDDADDDAGGDGGGGDGGGGGGGNAVGGGGDGGGGGGAAVLEEVSVATVREKQQAFFQSIVTGVKRGDVQLDRQRLIFPPPDPLLARPFSAANFALDPVQLWCPSDRYRSLGVRRVPCPN